MAKRLYTIYSEKSIDSILCAIDGFNSVHKGFKIEKTLIFTVNAWELLGKAILLKNRKVIAQKGDNSKTISAEEVISKLKNIKVIDDNQSALLQQVISLRNEAVHNILPPIEQEIQHHLFFFSCKYFKDLVSKEFSKLAEKLNTNFLSLSFAELTTYSDKVLRLISNLRRGSKENRRLVWLLERGIEYNKTNQYLPQNEFEKKYKDKKKIQPHLDLTDYTDKADMIRIVPFQAPKNVTVDINLRTGPKNQKESLPVYIKTSGIDDEYPFLTGDLAKILNKNVNFISKAISKLNLKGDLKYHTTVRTSQSHHTQRYSNVTLDFLKNLLKEKPEYNPYKD